MRDRLCDGAKLRSIRIRRQLLQKTLADLADVRNDTLCSIEAGRYQPGDLLAHRLAEALDCEIEDFSVDKPRPMAAA